MSLLDDIFPQLVDSNKDISTFTTENLPKRLGGMIGIAREIIVRHNRLDYEEIMKHCLEVCVAFNGADGSLILFEEDKYSGRLPPRNQFSLSVIYS